MFLFFISEREPKRCPAKVTSQTDFNLAWSPYHNIPEEKCKIFYFNQFFLLKYNLLKDFKSDLCLFVPVESYIQFSKEKSGFTEDQSLALLRWHEYNVEKAMEDQCTLEVCSDEWTQKEINRFESSMHPGAKKFFKLHRQLTKKRKHETADFHKSRAKRVSLYYRLKVMKMKSMGGIVKYKAERNRMLPKQSRPVVENEQ